MLFRPDSEILLPGLAVAKVWLVPSLKARLGKLRNLFRTRSYKALDQRSDPAGVHETLNP